MFKNLKTADNLGFLLAIPLCVRLSAHFGSIIGLILSFTLIPYLLTRFNKVTFKDLSIKDENAPKKCRIFTKNGIDITDKLPLNIVLLIMLFIGSGILVTLFNLMSLWSDPFISFFFILFSPVSYFIYKNIPISIMFSKDTWIYSQQSLGIVTVSQTNSETVRKNRFFGQTINGETITNPCYCYLPFNKFNPIRRKKH